MGIGFMSPDTRLPHWACHRNLHQASPSWGMEFKAVFFFCSLHMYPVCFHHCCFCEKHTWRSQRHAGMSQFPRMGELNNSESYWKHYPTMQSCYFWYCSRESNQQEHTVLTEPALLLPWNDLLNSPGQPRICCPSWWIGHPQNWRLSGECYGIANHFPCSTFSAFTCPLCPCSHYSGKYWRVHLLPSTADDCCLKHWGSLQTLWGSQDSSKLENTFIWYNYASCWSHGTAFHCNFNLSWELLFFTLELSYKNDKHDCTSRTLNFGIHTVWLVLEFSKIMILITSKDCLHLVTRSWWVPKDFQGQPLMVHFSKILIAMLQLMLSLRVARFHQHGQHKKSAYEKTKPEIFYWA